MARRRTISKKLRQSLAVKTNGKYFNRHLLSRVIIGLRKWLKPIPLPFATLFIITLVFGLKSDEELASFGPFTIFLATVICVYIALRIAANWVQESLFSFETRFFLGNPTDMNRTITHPNCIRLIRRMIGLLVFICLLAIIFHILGRGALPTEFSIKRPVLAGCFVWVGCVGIAGLFAPIAARKRISLSLPTNLTRVLGWGIVLLFIFGGVGSLFEYLDRTITAFLPKIATGLPPAWGWMWLEGELPVPEPVMHSGLALLALVGGFLFYRTNSFLRSLVQNNPSALLAPHFSVTAETSEQTQQRPTVKTVVKKAPAQKVEVLKSWRVFERILQAWLTPEEHRARRLACGRQWPPLTRRWLEGVFAIAVIFLLYFGNEALNAHYDQQPEPSPEFLPLVTLLSAILTFGLGLMGLYRLINGIGTAAIFTPILAGGFSAAKMVGWPVRWKDIMMVELKAVTVIHLATLIPVAALASVAANAMEGPQGLWIFGAICVQLLFTSCTLIFQNQIHKVSRRPSFFSVWFWLRMIAQVGGLALVLGGIFGTGVLLSNENLRILAILPPLAFGAGAYGIWYFIHRQAYSVAAFDLEK